MGILPDGGLMGSRDEAGRPAEQKPDMVNHPPHYTSASLECIVAIEAALTPEEFRGFCKGNIVKYVWRERHKGGDESVAKAKWYMERLLNYTALKR